MTENRVSHFEVPGPDGALSLVRFAPDLTDGPDIVSGAGRVRIVFGEATHDHEALLAEADGSHSQILLLHVPEAAPAPGHYPRLLALAGWLLEEAEHLGLKPDHIHFEDGAGDMKAVETSIKINASAQQVWDVMTDLDSYGAWNPYVLEAKSDLDIGSDIRLTLLNAGEDKPFRVTALIDRVDPPHHFGWRGKLLLPGLMDTHHHFTIKELGPDQCEFIHIEAFSGIMGPVVVGLVRETLLKTFDGMNEALKTRAEQG